MNTLKYLFTVTPGSYFNYYIALLIIAVLLFIAGAVLKKITTKNKALRRTLKKYPSYLLWSGLLLALLLAFRYERIPYFSMRFFLFLLLLLIILAVFKTVYLYIKNYKTETEKMYRPEEATMKYLPNKKRR